MHETFNTVFDFNEAAVVRDVGDFAEDASLLRIAAREILPRIVTQLLHAERYTLPFTVKLEDLDVDLLPYFNDL